MNTNESPIIFDTSDGQQLRINTIGSWLRRRFDRKIIKLSLDGGFTCPNRDGSKGWGGCLFCSESGSGDMASRLDESVPLSPGLAPESVSENASGIPSADRYCFQDPLNIRHALNDQIHLLSDKWPDAGYIAYFQSHTNTYAPAQVLRKTFETALAQPDVLGLAVATRSDCITDEALELLAELNQRTFLWVELGLQTIHDKTARTMNLCHCLSDYDDATMRLTARGIRTVTHLILGLPGETADMMLDSVRYVCRPHSGNLLFGLKLHMLNVVRGSGMETVFPDYVPFGSIDEYTDLVIDCLELIPPDITLHRISGDAPRSTLIAPSWSYRKRTILNEIHRKMRERNTWQGRLAGLE